MPNPTDRPNAFAPPVIRKSGSDARAPSEQTSADESKSAAPPEPYPPAWISAGDEGVFADLTECVRSPEAFREFVQQTFGQDFYFRRLDFRLFATLLYEPEKVARLAEATRASGRAPSVRFAQEIARFPQKRKPLYRNVMVSPKYSDAKYLFEPLCLELTILSADDQGEPVERTITEKAFLNFDELVAHLWNRGVRYGILEDEVRALIAAESPKPQWTTVARQLDPVPGHDAELEEVCDKLHRDKTPKIGATGRADLRQFKNTFPQIQAGVRLIRKIPKVMGVKGRDIAGRTLLPPEPKDIDLNRLAGDGVACEKIGKDEYLTSAIAGFLNIDAKSQQLSMTERLISREDISVKTTGSLEIEGKQFETRGSVEKGCSVAGSSIHVRGNVFGTVLSRGGIVKIGGNVMNGEVRNADGSIEVKGFASNAHLESRHGTVELHLAENAFIVARKLILGEARNCTILADEAEIANVHNCVVAGKRIEVGNAGIKQGFSSRSENVFILEVPDPASFADKPAATNGKTDSAEQTLAAKKLELDKKRARYAQLLESAGVRLYLELAKKLQLAREKNQAPDLEQLQTLNRLRSQLAPDLAEMSEVSKTTKTLGAEIETLEKEIGAQKSQTARVSAREAESPQEVAIDIKMVTGETVVRKRRLGPGIPSLWDIRAQAALLKEMDSLGEVQDRIRSAGSGSIRWRSS